MGAAPSQEEPEEDNGKANALGLSPHVVADVKRTMALVGPDAPTQCVQAHIAYFRQHPQHLERFCGRRQLPEPKHYSPKQLSRDKQFADRAVMHGLALMQVLRCSCENDPAAMEHLAAGLIHTHKDLNLTRDVLKDYADIVTEYITSRLQPAVTPSMAKSWRCFLYAIAEAMAASSNRSTAFQKYWFLKYDQPSLAKPTESEPQSKILNLRERLVQEIQHTMLIDPEAIRKTAASLIQKCERRILKISPPISTVKAKAKAKSTEDETTPDEPPCSKAGLCSRCVNREKIRTEEKHAA